MLNYDYKQSDLSRSVLGGLFSGIIATVLNMIFVYGYRFFASVEGFQGFDLTVIVFGSLLQSLVCGVVFYFFVHYLKRGITTYRIAVLVITILIVYFGLALRQSIFGAVPIEFRIIVITTQVVIGGLAAFLIPYLFRHDSIIS